MSLGSNGANRMCLLWKIKTRLRGTKFCTSSARFALSFVRQHNGPKCIQIVQNTPKHEFRSQGVNSVCSLRKIMTRLRGTNFGTSSARFALSFVRQPNDTKCIQIVQNTPKYVFSVQWGRSGSFVAKNSDATSWHELLHLFGPFCTESRKATKCTRIVWNAPKHQFRVQWFGSSAFVAKNSDATL